MIEPPTNTKVIRITNALKGNKNKLITQIIQQQQNIQQIDLNFQQNQCTFPKVVMTKFEKIIFRPKEH